MLKVMLSYEYRTMLVGELPIFELPEYAKVRQKTAMNLAKC